MIQGVAFLPSPCLPCLISGLWVGPGGEVSDWKQRHGSSGGRMRGDWGLQLTPSSPCVLYTSLGFGCAQILMVPLHHPFFPGNLMEWPKSLQPQFSAALSPCPCGWGRVGHQHLLAMPCPVQEQDTGNDQGLGTAALLSLPGLFDGSPRQS